MSVSPQGQQDMILSAETVNVISMSSQLELFKECIKKIEAAVGEERTATIETHYDINASSDFVAGYASQFLQDLYGLGARRIGLLGLSPIGCVPSQRTVGGGKNRDCYEDENQLASAYNAKHSGVVDNLKTMFEVATVGCCGTGLIEASVFCNPTSIPLSCEDASKYVFWDGYHPSEKA
ncbi:Detected protein of confused Function [Hibiscus syriacus]|uniref:Detected protein of confused Function n=1 Tax=Hibiscus syriacus TaxID=106335 RepID=A0A6A3AR15_HIBSY|nr:Detected protein of confused Function [Hibiscus syriacus]